MTEEKQTAPMEPKPPETTTALRDKRITPEGVVPKQAQGYVIARPMPKSATTAMPSASRTFSGLMSR